MARTMCLLLATAIMVSGAASARAADLGHAYRHRHHAREVVGLVRVPPGYAYGGYGNGPGPGWVEGDGPGFGPGYTPGWGYIPAGVPPTIFDLGY